MFSRFLLPVLLAAGFCGSLTAQTADSAPPFPDSLVLKDGRVIHGIILHNNLDAILIQEKSGEATYPKSEIVRIQDDPDGFTYFTEINRRGELPSWRVIVNDLRTHDQIKRLEEIPAIRITNGRFKNIPYKSFRVNNNIELNIYGDLERPAGLEMGIFGIRSGNEKLRKTLRAYLGGFLSTREEISALYALNFKGDTRQADGLVFETTPKDAPDAQGAWWISLSNPKKLARVRVSDAEYAKITAPEGDVVDKYGRLLSRTYEDTKRSMNDVLDGLSDTGGDVLQGFYRTKDGILRLMTKPKAEKAENLTN